MDKHMNPSMSELYVKNTEGLKRHAEEKTKITLKRVDKAIREFSL